MGKLPNIWVGHGNPDHDVLLSTYLLSGDAWLVSVDEWCPAPSEYYFTADYGYIVWTTRYTSLITFNAEDELTRNTVSRIGYYLPFSIFGTVLIAISNGIISTYSPTTSVGKRIGYQILMGVGYGSTQQMVLPLSLLSKT